MTQTSTAPVLPVPDATATGRNSIPGRWLVLPIIALTLLAIAAFIGSRFVAGSPLVDQVDVRVTNSECSGDGTSVRSESRITTVETAEHMRCTFTVQIETKASGT